MSKRFILKRGLILLLLFVVLYFQLAVETDLMKEETYLWGSTKRFYFFWNQARIARDRFQMRRAEIDVYCSLVANSWLYRYRRVAYVPFDRSRLVRIIVSKENNLNFARMFSNAILLLETGELAIAEKIFTALKSFNYSYKRNFHHSSHIGHYLGRIKLAQNKPEETFKCFKSVIDGDPGDSYALAYLYAIGLDSRYFDRIVRFFSLGDALLLTGSALLETGNAEQAVKHLRRLSRLYPELRLGKFLLSLALGKTGHIEEAAEYYIDAMSLRQEPIMAEKEILSIFKVSEHQTGNPKRLLYAGLVHAQFGYFDEALRLLNLSLPLSEKKGEMIREQIVRIKKYQKNYRRGVSDG